MESAWLGIRTNRRGTPLQRRAQVSLEFMFIIIILLFLTILFVIAAGNKTNEFQREKNVFLLKDAAGSVRNEIQVAYAMDSGYTRIFDVPDTLEGVNYSITIQNNFISAALDNDIIEFAIQPVNGSLKKGTNLIRKVNGVVFIN